ncbi:DUF504 domain-containing protein [Burkholderiaceae bacterium FT117]|uniref:DUF504 domain-containing protein n=1 Tax=Zeimonas sediminis TaxID=2944268 RepID=UPI002342CAC6|nr:DUF504 domain-containing protein [Zeimonas sediminis]MCM5569270.1 DUF504 domain-containing protein [Zeimonas sediminis]
MMPIHELLSRIRWDPAFGSADFTLGYWDRVQERIVTVPLREATIDPQDHFAFDVVDDEGEVHHVPFHRVRQVFRNGTLIWERPAPP